MSKPVKNLVVDAYKKRFEGVEGALVLEIRGVDSNATNAFRRDLEGKQIRVTIVKNTLAKSAFKGGPLEAMGPALVGPSAIAYGAESVVDVARELVSWAKKMENLQLKGAVLDGVYFDGKQGVKRLSEFPTKQEAQARVVTLVLSPGGKVVGAAKGPGGKVMGIVKEVQTRLEDGKAIAKVG